MSPLYVSMARNSIIAVSFLLLLSIKPSIQSDRLIRFAKNHLKAFGYLPANYTSIDGIYDEDLASALRTYQSFYRLNVTGRLEPDTLASMTQARSGVPDFLYKDTVADDVTPQYAFMPSKTTWPPSKRELTYWFSTPLLVPKDTMTAVLSSAFLKWSAVTKFTFQAAEGAPQPDLLIGFYNRDHGDGHPFDGPNGILAHSFAPTKGWLHYDGEEQWSTNPDNSQYDLESVSLHEIGHLLGLGHSADQSAVMFATFHSGEIKRDLQPDDIAGIHALYPQG